MKHWDNSGRTKSNQFDKGRVLTQPRRWKSYDEMRRRDGGGDEVELGEKKSSTTGRSPSIKPTLKARDSLPYHRKHKSSCPRNKEGLKKFDSTPEQDRKQVSTSASDRSTTGSVSSASLQRLKGRLKYDRAHSVQRGGGESVLGSILTPTNLHLRRGGSNNKADHHGSPSKGHHENKGAVDKHQHHERGGRHNHGSSRRRNESPSYDDFEDNRRRKSASRRRHDSVDDFRASKGSRGSDGVGTRHRYSGSKRRDSRGRRSYDMGDHRHRKKEKGYGLCCVVQ